MDRLSALDYIDPDEGRDFPEDQQDVETPDEPVSECPEALAIIRARHRSIQTYLEAIRKHHEACSVCGPYLEAECACVGIDADLMDSRHCQVHGPDSLSSRAQREEEAAYQAAFYRQMSAAIDSAAIERKQPGTQNSGPMKSSEAA